MLLTADHEKWLAVALALFAAMLVLAAAAARGRSWRWRIVGIVLPLLASLFIAIALAGTAAGKREVVIFLDFSPSARNMPWRDPTWVLDLASKHLDNDCQLVIVGFDGTKQEIIASVLLGSGDEPWPGEWHWTPAGESGSAGTDIDTLLAWRTPDETQHPQRTPAPRWIITDGLFSAPNVPPNMEVAWTILPPKPADAAVTEVRLRPVPTTAGEFELLTQIRVAARTKGTPDALTVHVDIQRDNVPLLDQDMPFHLGNAADAARWISVRDTLPESVRKLPHHYRVTATLQPTPDPWPENDRGEYILPAASGLRALVIGQNEPTFPHDAIVKTDRFTASAEQLAAEGWQVIILNDVPAEKLPGENIEPLTTAAAQQIQRAVEGNGTGLLILGNGHAFGPGRYGESSTAGQILETLAPFNSHSPKGSGRRIIFLLDTSASMNEAVTLTARAGTERKISWAAAGIQEAATRLPPGETVAVITFNNTSRVVFQGASAPAMPDLSRALQQLSPAGETAPDSALETVTATLGPPPAPDQQPPMLILLTDGEIPQMNLPRWRSVIESARAKLVIIAPPVPTSENSILRQLAAIPNATWSKTADPATWREDLVEAVMSEIRGVLMHRPIHWTTLSEPLLAGDTAAWTDVWQKQGFAIPLGMGIIGGNPAVPLAGFSQRSLGKVAALAISNDGTPTYRALVERLAKEVAAPPGDPRFTASAKRVSDRTWLLAVDGVDDNGFVNIPSPPQSLQAQVIDDRTTSKIPLPQTAPGHYEATLQVDGPFVASIIQRTSNRLIARIQSPATETSEWPATITASYMPPPDQTILSPDDATQWNPPPAARLNLTPACWIAAALCALAALWLRR